jgi:4,5-DOPA dioxygenase extradiol
MTTPHTRQAALFIGHGNPMNTLADNANTRAWRRLGARVAGARAILVISAHWQTQGIAVGAMRQPETLHDFYGFPRQLAEFQYPAPGDPDLARRVADCLAPEAVSLDTSWGLDHGAWSILAHLRPQADLPVLQLSLDRTRGAAEHARLAARLAPLRDEGVLILGSGNVAHNLGMMDWRQPDAAFPWAARFQARIMDCLTRGAHADLLDLDDADARLAVPTSEHFLPLLYIAALRAPGEPVGFANARIEYGAIDMLAYLVGLESDAAR